MQVKVTTLVLVYALAACVRCLAGTTGVMHGYVRNENGQPVADALVTVTSPSQISETHTDSRGFFDFLTLPPDVYTVAALKDGTSGAYAPGARVNSDQTTFLNLRVSSYLRCGAMFNRVTVAAYQGSDQFWSLDVRRMAQYPPHFAPPILLPATPHVQRLFCL